MVAIMPQPQFVKLWMAYIILQFWISKIVPEGWIDNKSALVQVMVWCQINDQPLPEAVLTMFCDAILGLKLSTACICLLTHWGRVTHICISKLTIIGSDNGLSPGRRQAIIWSNAGILLIRHLGTQFREILIGNQTFSFKKMLLKMLSAKWRPFCLGLSLLTHICITRPQLMMLVLPQPLPEPVFTHWQTELTNKLQWNFG